MHLPLVKHAPLPSFLDSSDPATTSHILSTLRRRESQRRVVCFGDAETLDRIEEVTTLARDSYCAVAALSRENELRNRYSDIVPYDRTRVLLTGPGRTADPGGRDSYINASWMASPGESEASFIASQAPTPETVHDFLSLFLSVPSSANPSAKAARTPPNVIVMLTACKESGRQKSARYWPDSVGGTVSFEHYIPLPPPDGAQSAARHARRSSGTSRWTRGPLNPISVTWLSSIPSPTSSFSRHKGWKVNRFRLATTFTDGSRQQQQQQASVDISHVEYLGWQDHGVPDDPAEVLALIAAVEALRSGDPSNESPHTAEHSATKDNSHGKPPIVVHCSAGVGRTGTFIAVSWLAPLLSRLRNGDASALSSLIEASRCSPLGPPRMPASLSLSHKRSPPVTTASKLLPSFLHRSDPPTPSSSSPASPASSVAADEKESRGFDPVMATIDLLRDQRTTSVQTDGQVEFVYKCLKTWCRDAK